MKYTANEIKAGISILAATVIALGLVYLVGAFDSLTTKTRTWEVVFDDIKGLKTSDPVLLAGVTVGKVEGLRFVETTEAEVMPETLGAASVPTGIEWLDARNAESIPKVFRVRHPTRVLLTMAVRQDVKIKDGYRIEIDKTLTNITSVLLQAGAGEELAPPMVLRGAPGTQLTELASQGRAIGSQIQSVLGSVEAIIGQPKLRSDITATLTSLRDTARQAEQDLRLLSDVVMENRAGLKKTITGLADLSETATTTLKNFDAWFVENREKLTDLVGKMDKGMASVQGATTSLQSVLAKTDLLLDENRYNLRKTFENLRGISQRANDVMADIKRHPWMLLHNPDDRELESLNVYDAAAKFNDGAAHLNDSVGTLTSYLASAPQNVDRARLDELVSTLNQSVKDYQDAEQHFWTRLKGAGK